MSTATQQANGHHQHEESGRLDDHMSTLSGVRPAETSGPDYLESAQLDVQVATARRFPRSIKKFLADAESMATISQDMAAACFYSVPRAGKTISGPSVRLAEICMSAWGHVDAGTRVKEIGISHVTVEGFGWDMERNIKVRQEVRRNITNKNGQRYKEDMITTTINAAASIALRNAILRIIPRAYVDHLWEKAKQVAVGDAKTLSATREAAIAYFLKIPGLAKERVFAALGVAGIDDVTIDHVGVLKGYATAIKDGEATVEECFPPLGDEPKDATKSLKEKIESKSKKKTEASSTSSTTSDPTPQQSPPPAAQAGAASKSDEPASLDLLDELERLRVQKGIAQRTLLTEAKLPHDRDLTIAEVERLIELLNKKPDSK